MADDLSQHGADPFASFDTAAPAPVPEPQPQDTTDHGPDPFAQFDPENQPVETGAGGAFMHHAERGLVPSLTGMAGAGMGASVGAEVGAAGGFMLAGPIGSIPGSVVGALGGGLAGFMGGAQAMSSAQDWLIKQMPESWQELLGQSEKQRAAEETQQPIASQIGELAPFVITMRPGFGGIPAAVPENASVLRRIWASPMTSHLLSGGLQGGTEAISEIASGEKPDPTRIAIATSFGLIFNKPTKLGERLTELGEHPIRVLAGRNEPAAVAPEAAAVPERPVPTIAEAADAQVLGPGITEGVFLGSVKQDPALRDAQQTAAHDEAAVLTPAEINPVETARTMEPELFAHYDDLQAQRADLAAHPDTAAVQQHIAATDAELRAIEPEVAAAHRRAADVAQTPTVEPPAPEPVQPTQPAPNGQVPTEGATTPPSRETLDAEQAAIAQEVTANLLAAGRPPEEAAAGGQLLGHYYRTRSAKFKGALGSPMELFRSQGPNIRRFGVSDAPLMPTAGRPNFVPEKAASAVAETAPSMAETAGTPSAVPTSELEAIDPANVGVDAKRFQFKEGGDEAGVSERLQGVEKWDARLAGTALVFRDAEGRNWVADGHQRFGLAKRLMEAGHPPIKVNAFVLDAKAGVTDAQARAIAAVKNIAEGTGSAIDAAKVLREAKESGIDLPPLPPRSTLVRDGRALAELSPEAFGAVVNGVVPPNQGAMIGRLVRNHADQAEAVRLLAATRPDNAMQAELMIRDMLSTGTDMMKQDSLFGEEAFASSIVLDRAKVAEEALKQLRRDKSTFRTLVDEAERIEGQGANVLDQSANQSRLSTDEKAADLLTQLAFRAGPVSDELSAVARRFKAKEISASEAARGFLGAVRSAVESGVDTGAEPRGTEPGAVGERPLDEGPELFQPAPPIDTPEFNNWFGDSKVVDESGAPLVVYHSTGAPDFEKFKRSNYDIGMHFGTIGQAEDRLNFKSSRNDREPSETQRMIPVYLSIKNPLRMEDQGAWGRDTMWYALRQILPDVPPLNSAKAARDYLESKGYDGIVYKNTGESSDPARAAELRAAQADARDKLYAAQRARKRPETSYSVEDQQTPEYKAYRDAAHAEEAHRNATGEDSYIAFDPTQIKSVYNRGTFDPKDPRILFQSRKPDPWREGEMFGGFETERGLEGLPQTLIPGVKPLTDAERMAAEAAKPLKGGAAPPKAGSLFDVEGREDEAAQPSLFQSKRGAFIEGPKPIIKLFKDADASTFFHEVGHQWLEDMMRDAAHPSAPDEIKADAITVRNWLGIKDDVAVPGINRGGITTRQHEKFATGFEQYLREGVAPSPGLARVFAQFKQWLTQIYQSIRGLGAPINEDIRQVFDRMLAEEPNRTVIAPDQLERGPTLHDIHETEAEDVTPEQAGPVADRIVAERDDYLARQPAEIRNELETAVAQQEEAERAAAAGTGGEPSGETGNGAEPGAAVGDAGGEPVAEPTGGAGGGQPSPVISGGGEVVPEGVDGAELRSNGPGVAGDARTLPPEPEPAINRAPRFVDKAGNIRLDNINPTDDIKQVLRDFAEQNNDFIDYRRGVLKAGDVLNLAHAIGETDPDFLMRRRIGQSFNAEQIKYAEKLLAQSAQSLALTMKPGAGATPTEVQAYATARSRHQMIQAHFSGITAEAGRALAALRRTQAFWSPEAAAADKASREATGRTLFQLQQEMALGAELDTPEKVSRFLRDATKKNFVDGILEYWISALLSGTKTWIVNDVSNLVTAVNHFGPDIAAAAIAGRVRKALGREGPRVHASEIAVAARAAGEKGVPIGVKAMLDSFKAGRGVALPEQTETPVLPFVESAPDVFNGPALDEGATYREIVPEVYGTVKGAIDAVISNGRLLAAGGVKGSPLVSLRDTATGVIPNLSVRGVEIPVGDVVRLPLRNLSSHDSFFRAANYTIEKARTAYRTALEEGLKPNTPAFARRVAEASDNFTPEQMTEASDVAHSLTFMGRRGPFTSALVRLAQSRPFNMPLPKFIVPFVSTPLAIIESAVVHRTPLAFLAPEVRADLMGRNGNIAQDMAVGRLLMGTLYGVAGAGLASMGMLSGSGPQNSNDAAAWRMAGNQAHSVRVGDMWYQVNQLGPIGLWLSMVADGHDVAGAIAQGDWPTVFSGMQQAFAQNVVDMSSLTGVSDLMQAISDPDRYGTNYVSKFLSSFVPAIAAQVARSIDPYQRQARGIIETAQARIPFQSQNLPVKRDIYGDPIPQNMPAFGAVYSAKVQTDPLNTAFQEGGYWPGYVRRTIRGVQLTEAEFDQYSMVAGRLLRQNLMPVVGSSQWQSLPAARKHDILSKAVTMSRESARNFMLGRYPRIAIQAVRAKQGLDETP